MKTAAHFGLCAGKLYVPSHLVKGRTPAAGFQCSGVTLERRYFMTVCHFEGIDEESLIELMKPYGKAVSISIARSSKFSGSKEFQVSQKRIALTSISRGPDYSTSVFEVPQQRKRFRAVSAGRRVRGLPELGEQFPANRNRLFRFPSKVRR